MLFEKQTAKLFERHYYRAQKRFSVKKNEQIALALFYFCSTERNKGIHQSK